MATAGCVALAAIGWTGFRWVGEIDRRTGSHAVILRQQIERAVDLLEAMAAEPGQRGAEAREVLGELRSRLYR